MTDIKDINAEEKEIELLKEFLMEFNAAQDTGSYEVEIDDLYAAFELWKSSRSST